MKRTANLSEFDNDGACSLKEICDTKYHPLEWLIPDIIPLEGVTMLVGSPKSGKSLFVLNIIISYLVSDIILNFYPTPDKKINILYLDLEASKRRIKERAMKIIGDSPCPTNLVIANDWPRFGEGSLEKLRYRLGLEHFDLVIIDILGKVQSMRKVSNVHSYSLDQQEIDKFSQICKDFRTSIILVHHTRKAKSEDWVDMVSGSHGISGTVDTLLYLYRVKGQTGATLHVVGRDIEEETYRLDFDKSSKRWEMIGRVEDIISNVSKESLRILNLLNAHEGMLTPTVIANQLGKSVGSVKMHLLNLLKDDLILREKYGHYTKRILP